jgi:putative membrane protein
VEIKLGNIYLWIKVLHVMFMVAWMAGLLYTPRLFVYHAENIDKPDLVETFKTMEYRLYYYIASPSALIVWITGLYMFHALGIYNWLNIKIGFVIIMTVYHFYLNKYLKEFQNDICNKSAKFFRLINEIPFLLLFFIIILVIIKPEF